MTGRQEHDMKIEENVARLLVNAPQMVIDYSYNFGNKTEGTKLSYIRHVLKFFEFFKGTDVTTLKKNDINRFMESIRYKEDGTERGASFRKTILAAVRDFYQFLVDEEVIENNPCANVKPPRVDSEKEIVAMDSKDMEKVIGNIENANTRGRENIVRNKAIFILGCTTGLRVSAITEINMSDIDFNNNTIKVIEKGNKGRIINVGNNTMNALKEWIQEREKFENVDTDALFISRNGSRISVTAIRGMLEVYTRNLGKHITPHKMRSSCATNLYDKTNDIYLVQEVLGHRNIANTRRYARISEEKKQKAAAILDEML